MKLKLWLRVAAVTIATSFTGFAGPAVKVFINTGNNFCPPVRSAPIFCQPAAPIVYQPYGVVCRTPVYYSIGPTTVTYTSGNTFTTQSFGAPMTTVAPVVVPPPVIINRPVTVYEGTSFRWKR